MSDQQPEIKPVNIGDHLVGPGQPVYIVAELSANHRQDFDEALRLIHAAKEAGADAVKLQTYTPDTMTIDCEEENFRHGKGSLWEDKTLYELYKEAYMPWEWQPKLKQHALDLGLDFFSTAYDLISVDFLEKMGVPIYKVSSFELVDLPLIKHIAETGKPIILSTGMASLNEIEAAVTSVRKAGPAQIALLKCISAYPAPSEEMNLRTIPHMADHFSLPCGLSDHTRGYACALAAVALGACIIEKHFTLSRKNGSADSAFSMQPSEFKEMVEAIRQVEDALGEVSYGVGKSERQSLKFRRSLFVVADVVEGEVLTPENTRSIRPSHGLHPNQYDNVIGRKAKTALQKGTPISWDMIV